MRKVLTMIMNLIKNINDNINTWKDIGRVAGLVIGFCFVIYSLYITSTLGKGDFDKNVTKTKNVIAYIHYSSPGKIGVSRSSDIYLLDVKTGEQLRVTRDQYEYTRLCWSPDATRLLFTSKRSREKMARHSDAHNPSFLYIYDFRNGSERSLEKNLKHSVYKLGVELKKQGHEIDKYTEKYLDTYYPFWIDINHIGFMRKLPFGLGRGYGDICSSDTLGNNLQIYRDISEYPNWVIKESQWINNDSIIVSIRPFGSSVMTPKRLALFLPKKGEFISLTNGADGYSSDLRLSNDRKKILFGEYRKSTKESRLVSYDLLTKKKLF